MKRTSTTVLVACFVAVGMPGGALAQPQPATANMGTGALAANGVSLPGVPADVEEFSGYPELGLAQAILKAVEYSPQLQAQAAVVEQVKTNTTRAWAMLLPTLDVSGSYTLTDQEIKLDMGSGFADLFRLVAMNCGLWDEATMGPAPTLCQTPVEPATGSGSTSSSSERVIQQRHNWDASVTAAISLLNLRTWPNLANVYTAIELTELQKRFSEEQVVYAVVQMYYGIATAQESVRLTKETLLNALHHMDLVEIRFKNGVALQNERVRQAIVVIQARNTLDQALLGLALARQSLGLMLGLSDVHFRVAEGFQTPWDALAERRDLEESLGERKDIQMLEKTTLMADRNVDDAIVRFFPVIQGIWKWSISSNKGFGESYDNWRAMITLSWNIFDGGYRFADLDERKAKLREMKFNREQALVAARTEVAKAKAEVESATMAMAAGESMVHLAEENLRIVEKQYQLGAAPQTTVTDAELQFTQARIQVVTAKLRMALARVALVKAAGKLEP